MLVTLLGAAISGEVLHGVRRDYRRPCDGRAPVAGPGGDDRELAWIAAEPCVTAKDAEGTSRSVR